MSCGYFLLVSVSTLHVVDVLWNTHILPWIARWMHQRREIEEVVKLTLETKLLNHLDRSLTGRKFEANLKLCTWHIEQQKIINQMEEMLRGWPHSTSGRKYLSNPESHFSVQGPLILPLLTSCSIKHGFCLERDYSLARLLAQVCSISHRVTDYWWTLFILLWSC